MVYHDYPCIYQDSCAVVRFVIVVIFGNEVEIVESIVAVSLWVGLQGPQQQQQFLQTLEISKSSLELVTVIYLLAVTAANCIMHRLDSSNFFYNFETKVYYFRTLAPVKREDSDEQAVLDKQFFVIECHCGDCGGGLVISKVAIAILLPQRKSRINKYSDFIFGKMVSDGPAYCTASPPIQNSSLNT